MGNEEILSEKIYLPLFPFITFPGWLWDYLSTSHMFVARKTEAKKFTYFA
jgi:hypothetical protein